jgi:hypothetical protein
MGVSSIRSIKNYMVLHLPKSFIKNVNTFSYLISKFMTWSLFLSEPVPHNERVVGNTWNGVGNTCNGVGNTWNGVGRCV